VILVALDAIADAPRAINARVAHHLGITPPPTLRDLHDPVSEYPDTVQEDARRMHALEANAPGPGSAAATASPHAHASDSLARLARRNLIAAVTTTRAPACHAAAGAWLASIGLGTLPIEGITDPHGHADVRNLMLLARHRRVGLLIEHDPRIAHAVANAGMPVILFDLPYNEALTHPLVLRAYGWAGINDALTALPLDVRKDRRGF
jgi:hypothetical protein